MPNTSGFRSFLVLGVCLVTGLYLFGSQVKQAVMKGRDFDRYLTVRGLSEIEVKADLAIWPLKLSVQADDLAVLRSEMEQSRGMVRDFLRGEGFKDEEISLGVPVIEDRELTKMHEQMASIARYVAKVPIVVRSADVDRVKAGMQKVEVLLAKGVALSMEEWGDRPQFLFGGVNRVKPDMIKEATANARAAAEKFAQDSNSKVGRIRKAQQGVLEIDDRDPATPELKRVRVVTTVEFFLE